MEGDGSHERPEELQARARLQIIEQQKLAKEYFDRRHYEAASYAVGDVVVMQRAPEHTGEPTKTQAKYRGPLIITEVLPSDTYRLMSLKGAEGGRIYATTAHVSQLKIYGSRGAEDDGSEDDSDHESEDCEESQTVEEPAREIVDDQASRSEEETPATEETVSNRGEPPRRPTRTKKTPPYLLDYLT